MHARLYKIAVNQFNAVTVIKMDIKFASLPRRILFNYAIVIGSPWEEYISVR